MYQTFILSVSLFIALIEVKFLLYFEFFTSNNSMRNFGICILITLVNYIAINVLKKS